jgi:hypothetical protein
MDEAVRRFTDSPLRERLPGGQGRSVRAGDLVLKPVDEVSKYEWLGDALEGVDFHGLKAAAPMRSLAGAWCEQGWGATRHVDGAFVEGRMVDKLAASTAFHRAVSHIGKPAAFDTWTNPWTAAAQVAWNERSVPEDAPDEVKTVVRSLQSRWQPVSLPSQFVHTDLAPAASLELLDLPQALRRQLVLRAVVFRLCVPLFFDAANIAAFYTTLREFEPVLAAEGMASG